MDEILNQAGQTRESEGSVFATVGAVSASGVTLILDGEDAAGEKLYKCNTGAVLKAGDRVKITADSGTYIIDYPVGTPGASLQLPAGGTDGQVLTKDGTDDYTVKWADAAGSTNYIPTGGTVGQLLAKNSVAAYDLKWVDAESNPLPTGGSDGQVLTKSGATNYAVKWADCAASQLKNGSYIFSLSSSGALTPSSSGAISLGTASVLLKDIYASGTVKLTGGAISLCGSSGTLSFFGATGARRQSVAATATVATLITALKAYGLIS